jgi:uncharacterized membrane protein
MAQIVEMDTYMTSLRSHLGHMTPAEREEILMEINAHIRDSVEGGTALETVLQRLGPADELAAQYRDGLLIRKARHSISPWLLLRAALRLATKGISGVVIFFAAVFGYAFGVGFVLSAFAKCIFPAHTGAWVRGGDLVISGTQLYIPQPPAHEILGWWYVPITLTIGSLLTLATTFVIRSSLRISKNVQAKVDLIHHTASVR